ncbi:hypothetical protein B7494_g3675 [Chlorociboria aeruginascens]|nr:hypothetical protein B7494_g3675 [Chlorociboria aeruginascens]
MEILIPPIEHTYKSITYTCTGEGLYKEGYHYDAHPEKFFPPKVPKHLKPPPTEPKEVEKKPVAYWKAQCAFRGLNQSGAISDLQLRIREAKKKMLPELKMAETELNREFKKKNKAAKDATAKNGWNSLQTVEAKAKANPQKFLTEAFPKGATGRPANLDIVLVKIDNPYRLALADAAEAMSLETVTVDAPWTGKKTSDS